MLDKGITKPLNSEWASLVLFSKKDDGSLRFGIAYRRFNEVRVRDPSQIPRMDECIVYLGDATVFTTLDANRGFRKIQMNEADKDKTKFPSHCRLF